MVFEEQSSIHGATNYLSLLLASPQSAADTQSAVDHMKTTTYVLDIFVLNGVDVFLTWVSVPRFTTQISTLHVDLRLLADEIIYEDTQEIRLGDYPGFH